MSTLYTYLVNSKSMKLISCLLKIELKYNNLLEKFSNRIGRVYKEYLCMSTKIKQYF